MVEVSNKVYAALEIIGQDLVCDLAIALNRAKKLHPEFATSTAEAATVVYNEACELVASVHDKESPDRQRAEALDTAVTAIRFMRLEWLPEFGVSKPVEASEWVKVAFDADDDFEGLREAPGASDMVNHPPHYTAFPVEVIDMIKAVLGPEGFKAYCFGNEIKYRMRAGLKGVPAEDYDKAMKYKEFRDAVE